MTADLLDLGILICGYIFLLAFIPDFHLTLERAEDTVEMGDECRLSGAAVADDRDDLTFLHIERHIGKRFLFFLFIAVGKRTRSQYDLILYFVRFLFRALCGVRRSCLQDLFDLPDRVFFRGKISRVRFHAAESCHFAKELRPLRKFKAEFSDHIDLREYFGRCAVQLDLSFFEDDHTIGQIGLVHIVGNMDDRDSLVLAHPGNKAKELVSGLRIEHGCTLIQDQELRLHRQDSGDRQLLLLSAGKCRRLFVCLFQKTDIAECFFHALGKFGKRYGEILRTKGDIFFDRGSNDLVIRILEYHAAVCADRPEVLILAGRQFEHGKGSLVRSLEKIEHLGHCRFAGSVTS